LLESPAVAQQQSERGLIRLLQLHTAAAVKYLRKELLRSNSVTLQLAGIEQRREEWLDEILEATYREVFLAGQVLPRSEDEFNQRLQKGQGSVTEVAQRYAAILEKIAMHYSKIRAQLRQNAQLAWLPAHEEIDAQLQLLFKPHFIVDTPWQWLQQYPRYLQAIEQRIEKWRGFFTRDRELSRELKMLQNQLNMLLAEEVDVVQRSPLLQRYRWLLEELRVSLFAQTLGTSEPISSKRLRDLWPQVLKEVKDAR
jgi:ATP-dependent helicase HrpA